MMPENFYFKQALKNKKNQLKIIKLKEVMFQKLFLKANHFHLVLIF